MKMRIPLHKLISKAFFMVEIQEKISKPLIIQVFCSL